MGDGARRYEVRLIGSPSVRCAGQAVHFARRRSLAVVAYTLLSSRSVSRNVLATLLWPDSDRGRSNLRTVLSELRDRVPDLLLMEGEDLRRNPHCEVDLDVADLAALAGTSSGRPSVDEPLLRSSDALLEGVELAHCSEFDHWLASERHRVEGLRRAGRRRSIEALLERRCLTDAIALAAIDAAEAIYDESVNADLVRLLLRAGRRTDAVRHADLFARRLEEDLGVAGALDVAFDDAPPRSPGLRRPVLPAGDLIGRSDEVTRLELLLRRTRLTTVVGPGGVGKSRLAEEAVGRTDAADGAVFVRLRDAREPADVAHHVAASLHLSLGPQDIGDQVAAYLAGLDVLLVLDGAEHVVDAVVELVDRIFADGRRSRVLVTSRCALDAVGEAVLRVGPLTAPDARTLLLRSASGPGLPASTEDPRTLELVDELCSRVDRLPLAVLVVARRAGRHGLGSTVAALGSRSDGHGDRLSELSRIDDVIDWSVQLQTAATRAVLSGVGVFAGSFDAEAVAAVCGMTAIDAAHHLEVLTAHSLLEEEPGRPASRRWRALRTVADHAQRLAGDERPLLERRHARHFHERVAELDLFDLRDAARIAAMAPDLENHGAAFRSFADAGEWEEATEVALGCYGIFSTNAWTLRGRSWLERCLQHTDVLDRRLVERARGALVQLCLVLDDADGVEHHGALLEHAMDPRIRAEATGTRALPLLQTRPARAAALLSRSLAALDAHCPPGSTVWPRAYTAFQAMYAGDLTTALHRLDRSIGEAREVGHTSHLWILEDAAASCELLLGMPQAVLHRLRGTQRPDTFWDAGGLLTGLALLSLDQLEDARRDLLAFADPACRRQLPRSANDALVGLAALAAAEGHTDLAIEILGNSGRGRMPATIGLGRRLASRLGGTARVERLRARLEAEGRLYASADDLLARQWEAARARATGDVDPHLPPTRT